MNRAASTRDRRARSRKNTGQQYPARTLHLIDIENLAGTGRPNVNQVRDLYALYHARVGVGAMDQIVVACSQLTLKNTCYCWPGARYLVRAGPNGADLELLNVIDGEHVVERFSKITIASGDGIFSVAAAGLAAAGCSVTVVSRRGGLSKRLAISAASRVIYIDVWPAIAASSVA